RCARPDADAASTNPRNRSAEVRRLVTMTDPPIGLLSVRTWPGHGPGGRPEGRSCELVPPDSARHGMVTKQGPERHGPHHTVGLNARAILDSPPPRRPSPSCMLSAVKMASSGKPPGVSV